MQELAEKSKLKSELLKSYSGTASRIEVLEGRLAKVKDFSLKLQSKLDSNAAEYFAEKKALEAAKDALIVDNNSLLAQKDELLEKNKKLRQREAGEYSGASTYFASC